MNHEQTMSEYHRKVGQWTAKEGSKVIGSLVSIEWRRHPNNYDIGEEVKVYFEVKDVKMSYGIVRYLVQPLKGEGTMWVNVDSIDTFLKD